MVKEIIRTVVGLSKCSLLIVAMDIAAGIYGIKAQDAQSQAKHVRNILFECEKRSYMYGMYAVAGVVGAHVVMEMLGSWIIASSTSTQEKHGSISNYPSLTQYIGLLSHVAAWLIYIPAVMGLVMGAKSSKIQCGMTHHNFLYYGGLSCFLHAIFSIAYLAHYGSMYNIPKLIKLD